MLTQRVKNLGRTTAVVALLMMAGAASVDAQSPPAGEVDLLIVNGHVIDGTGSPWMQENVAIKGDRIVYVGRAPVKAKKTLDVHGLVVSPGFIDMHSHSEFGLALDGRALSKVTQGITTELMGEHLSAGPVLGPAVDDPMMVAPPVKRTWTTLGGFFSYLQKKGIGINVASYVGAGQVRASAMGYAKREPTPAEWDRTKQLIRQAMEEGAMGLSMGLYYAPNSFYSTQQLIDLAKVAGDMGGFSTIHTRPGPDLSGVKEAIAIAKGAHIPMEILHVGMGIAHNPEMAATIERARAAGIDVTANAYPYTVGWTYVRQLLPVWAQVGTADDITARLKDPVQRAKVIADLQKKPGKGFYGRWTISSANLAYDGKTLQQLADAEHVSVEEAMVDYLAKNHAEGFQIGPANPSFDQKEAETFRYPWIDVGSDGISLPAGVHTGFGKPHPRSFGSHARILAEVVRHWHVLTLEQAVRQLSSQAADRMGLHDRGLIRQGMKADVVVFNPDTVKDNSTWAKPDVYASGISWVFVNGTAVVANGKPTNALPGQIVRGPGYKPGTP
jgi:N-acyl-D-aspartate/D-glutamate deacylase